MFCQKKKSVKLVLVTTASVGVYNEHVMAIIQHFTFFLTILQPLISFFHLSREVLGKMGV